MTQTQKMQSAYVPPRSVGGYKFQFAGKQPELGDTPLLREWAVRLREVEERSGVTFRRSIIIGDITSSNAAIDDQGRLHLSDDLFNNPHRDFSEQDQKYILFHEASHVLNLEAEKGYFPSVRLLDAQSDAEVLLSLSRQNMESLTQSIARLYPDAKCFSKTIENLIGYLRHGHDILAPYVHYSTLSSEQVLEQLTQDPDFALRMALLPQINTKLHLAYTGSDVQQTVYHSGWAKQKIYDYATSDAGTGKKNIRVRDGGEILEAKDGKVIGPKDKDVEPKEREIIRRTIHDTLEPALRELQPTLRLMELYVRAIETRAELFACHHMQEDGVRYQNKRLGQPKSEEEKIMKSLFPDTHQTRTHPDPDEVLHAFDGFRPAHEPHQTRPGWAQKLQCEWNQTASQQER